MEAQEVQSQKVSKTGSRRREEADEPAILEKFCNTLYLFISGFLRDDREQDLKRGTLVGLALDTDGPAMLLNDAPGNGEAQASAAALRAEKRTKQTTDIFRCNANSIILNGDVQSSRLFGTRSSATPRSRGNRLSRHGKATARTHGFDCVEQQVHECLFQLVIVTAQEIAGSAVLTIQLNGFVTELSLDQA